MVHFQIFWSREIDLEPALTVVTLTRPDQHRFLKTERVGGHAINLATQVPRLGGCDGDQDHPRIDLMKNNLAHGEEGGVTAQVSGETFPIRPRKAEAQGRIINMTKREIIRAIGDQDRLRFFALGPIQAEDAGALGDEAGVNAIRYELVKNRVRR